jgi:hypothetical protein
MQTKGHGSRAKWSHLCVSAALLAGVLALQLTLPLAAAEQSFSREYFGAESIPVWTPLTGLERRVLGRLRDGGQVDADTVLALYLIASGDVRTEADLLPYLQTINKFLADITDSLQGLDERDLGQMLLSAMHGNFFAGSTNDQQSSAYKLNQSTLTGIFHTRTYNCISSALLYSTLAQKSGLQVSGVIMTSHAFVQLELGDGEHVEVETTSPTGFDVLHDERFYSTEAAAWFNARLLPQSNYEDYQNRRIVSAVGLGLENLWSQHTSADNMDYQDRMRLAELKGFLQPADFRAQHNRLIYYYREASFLRQHNETATLLKLYRHIEPFLESMDTLARSRDAMADKEFQTVFQLVQATRAKALIESGHGAAGLTLALDTLATLDHTLRDSDVIKSDLYLALSAYVERMISTEQFSEARAVFADLEEDCATEVNCVNTIDRLYAAWANSFWQKQAWQEAAGVYRDYLALELNSPNTASFLENLEAAYLNLANQAWFDEDHDAALGYLDTCERQVGTSRVCSRRREQMQTAY